MITINNVEEVDAAVQAVLRDSLAVLRVDRSSSNFMDFAAKALRQRGSLIEYFGNDIKADINCIALAMKTHRGAFRHALDAAATDPELQRISQIRNTRERVEAIEFFVPEEQPIFPKGGPLVEDPKPKTASRDRFFDGVNKSDAKTTAQTSTPARPS